jgi:WD40 repeat protein
LALFRSWIRQNSDAILKFGNFSYSLETSSRDLEAICLKCLEKDPSRRYERAADLAADLHRYLDGRPTVARPVGWSGRAVKCARRRPAIAALVATLLLTAVGAIIGSGWYRNRFEQVEAAALARIERQADAERERRRRLDYATYIQHAYQAWQSTDLKSAIELLDRCRPKTGEEDLRGWEWYYVQRLCAGGIVTLRGHDGPVYGAAFSPDGEQLASCGADGTLRIWDVGRGLETATIVAHKGSANAVAWSADGILLTTVGDDAAVRLWDTETHELRFELKDASGPLHTVAFSPDSRHVAAAGADRAIRIWDVATGEAFPAIEGHTDTIRSIAFSPDGSLIASGSDDRTARVWNLRTPSEPLATFEPGGPLVSVAFSPDGQTLATGDSHIALWDLSGRLRPIRMNVHGNRIRSVTFSPNGKMLASCAEDMTVVSWDLTRKYERSAPHDVTRNAKNVLHTYRGHTSAVFGVTFSPRGNRLASGGKDGTIQIWDPSRPQDRLPLEMESAEFTVDAVAFSPVSTMLAIASNQRELRIWTSLINGPATVLPLDQAVAGRSMSFSPDGHSLAYVSQEGRICIYDAVRSTIQNLREQIQDGSSCEFSANGKYLAVASLRRNSSHVIDVETAKVLSRIPGQRCVAISPDGRLLATQSSDVGEFYAVELWDIVAGGSAGRLIGHKGQIDSIEFSADGRVLATGSGDGTARLWYLEDFTEQFVLRAHRGGVQKVAFLLDDKSLATAGGDGTVTIWSVATGQELLSLDVVTGGITGMAVSADGRTLVTAGTNADGSIRVDLWPAPEESPELVLGRAVAE